MHHLWSAHVASAGARSGFGSCTKWSLARRVTCLCGGPLQRRASGRPASASCPGIVSSWLHYWYPLSPRKGTGRGSRQAPKESSSSWAASLSLYRAPTVILELSSGARDQTQVHQEMPEPLSRSADLAETGAHRRLLTGEVRFRELGFSRCPSFHLQTRTWVCSQ